MDKLSTIKFTDEATMYTFAPDNTYFTGGQHADVAMLRERGERVGRIVNHGDYWVGHFDAIPAWWPVSHQDLEGALRCMINVANDVRVQERISA